MYLHHVQTNKYFSTPSKCKRSLQKLRQRIKKQNLSIESADSSDMFNIKIPPHFCIFGLRLKKSIRRDAPFYSLWMVRTRTLGPYKCSFTRRTPLDFHPKQPLQLKPNPTIFSIYSRLQIHQQLQGVASPFPFMAFMARISCAELSISARIVSHLRASDTRSKQFFWILAQIASKARIPKGSSI